MDCRTPGLPVHRQLLELAQTHVDESVMPKQVCFYRCPGPPFPIFGDKGVLPAGAGVTFLALRETERRVRVSVLHWGHFFIFAVLCLRCSAQLSLVAVSGGYSSGARLKPLLAVVSLVAEHRLKGAWASVVTAHELSCPKACGIFPDQGLNPCPLH